MIQDLSAELRRILEAEEVTETDQDASAVIVARLTSSRACSAEEAIMQLEAVIAYCGLAHAEEHADRVVHDAMRSAITYLRARG